MVKAIDRVIDNYARKVKKLFPDAKIFLFGSYAKGNYDEDSDIDIAVFSSKFKETTILESQRLLFKLAREYHKYNIDIQPLAFSMDALNNNLFAKQEVVEKGLMI